MPAGAVDGGWGQKRVKGAQPAAEAAAQEAAAAAVRWAAAFQLTGAARRRMEWAQGLRENRTWREAPHMQVLHSVHAAHLQAHPQTVSAFAQA